MISQRFPQSQFILISLKEGMFQNANVLYKVHFAEGESKVERQVLKQNKKR
jgi:structural maintenance of chromosome 2